MKKAMFISSLLFCTLAAAQEVSVKTSNGQQAKVSVNEIVVAYGQVMQNPPINSTFVNGDGSTTIVNPHVLYAGQYVPLRGRLENVSWDLGKHRSGMCKYFGLGDFQAMETMPHNGEADEDGVELSSEGKILGHPKREGGFTTDLVQSVTCSAKSPPEEYGGEG